MRLEKALIFTAAAVVLLAAPVHAQPGENQTGGDETETRLAGLVTLAGGILEAVESGDAEQLQASVDPAAGVTFWSGGALGELTPELRIYRAAPEELSDHLLGPESPWLQHVQVPEGAQGALSPAPPAEDAQGPGVHLFRTSQLERPWPHTLAERRGEGSRSSDEHPWKDFRWVLEVKGEATTADFFISQRDGGFHLTNIAVYPLPESGETDGEGV